MSGDVFASSERPLPRLGRYETVRVLGRGGFAAVYEAYDPALDASVAIKVLGDHHSTDPDVRERFIREARLLRKIGSDRLVAVHDIGENDGQPYFVMGLAKGGTLADRIAALDGRAADLDSIQHAINELRSCLDAVHGAGVVHRDIKPSNVLIEPGSSTRRDTSLLGTDDRLLLGDFGLARELDASGMTIAGGTDGYMAPEQRAPSATIDQRADLYAATAIIAALVSAATTPDATPTRVTSALATGMAEDPADRPPDATAWRQLLLASFTDSEVAPPATTATTRPHRPPTPRRRGVAIAFAGALAAATIGIIAWLSLAGGEGPTIVGPEQIQVGDATIYRADERDGASYFWIDWAGQRHDGPALEVDPAGPGILPIQLTEVVEGEEASSQLTIRVRE